MSNSTLLADILLTILAGYKIPFELYKDSCFSFSIIVGSVTIILLVAGLGYTFVLPASNSTEGVVNCIIRAALVVISVLLHLFDEELASVPIDVLWLESNVFKVQISLVPSNGTSKLATPGLKTTGCLDASKDPPLRLLSVPMET